MKPEERVKAAVRAYLKEIGAYQFWPVQMGFGSSTIDCLFCYNGKFMGVETKAPGVKQPTPRQACVMSEIAHAGGGVCLENDLELPTLRKLIR